MPICIPIKELKNGAEFARTVRESAEPVIVTRNGHEEFVSMTPEHYEAMRLEAARAGLYRAVEEAEDDFLAGRATEARDSIRRMRERHGL